MDEVCTVGQCRTMLVGGQCKKVQAKKIAIFKTVSSNLGILPRRILGILLGVLGIGSFKKHPSVDILLSRWTIPLSTCAT